MDICKFLFLGCSTIHKNASLYRSLLAKYLVNNGQEVHILLEDDPVNREWVTNNLPNVHHHYQPLYKSFQDLPFYLAERRRLIRQIQPDIVHFLGIGWKNLLTLSSLKGEPNYLIYIADFDELYSAKASSSVKRLLYGYMEKIALQISTGSICASKFLLKHFSELMGQRDKLLYLPYAYEPDVFQSCHIEVEKIRASYRPRKILIYMGTLCKDYQSHKVLDLANHLQGKRDQLVFILIGGGSELEFTKKYVVQKKLEDFVYVLGYLPDDIMYKYLSAADVLLFPIENNIANQARCPNKTFQYIGANKPVVTNRVGEVEQALGDDGYYYEFDNLESFESAIIAALADSEIYNSNVLLKLHTWEQRCSDYQKWIDNSNLLNCHL